MIDAFERHFDALRAIGASDTPHAAALALYRTIGKEFICAGILKLLSDACQLATPLLLRYLIGKLEAGADLRGGAAVTGILFLVSTVQALALRHYFAQLFACGQDAKAAIVGASYRKLLRLSPSARLGTSSGEITNLLGQDAQRIADLVPYLHALWFAPLQVVAALTLLYVEVGLLALLPGVGVVALMLLTNKWIAQRTFAVQETLLRCRDVRVRLVRELLLAIKPIKLHAWEQAFGTRLGQARAAELAQSRLLVRLRSLLAAVFSSTPTLVTVALLCTHVALGRSLTLRTAMTTLSAVNLLRSPLLFLPLVLQSAQEARSSLGRTQAFLNAAETRVITPGPLRDGGISFEAADLAWPVRVSPLLRREGVFGSDAIVERELSYDDDDDASASGQYQTGTSSSGQRPFLLRGISLAAARGELVAVVGAVGAGKTALLSALTGDMDTVRGMVHVRGSIAYAAQRPFLLSASVRENILFGLPYDEARYVRVIKACALASEVADMPAGDLTIVGERGLSLSGGQRARVALARAAYSDAQVVLLDDPLAAVDGAVARHLMAECIGPGGLLSDRLVIMATNQLELLRAARRIVLLRQGEIVEEGSYETLSTAEDGEFAKLLALQRQQHSESAAGHSLSTEQDAAQSTEAWQVSQMSQIPQPPQASQSSQQQLLQSQPPAAPSQVSPTLPADSAADGGEENSVPAQDLGASSDPWTSAVDEMDEAARPTELNGADSRFAVAAAGEEERRVGRVASSVLLAWLEAAGGLRVAPAILAPLISSELLTVGASWWLTQWAAAPTGISVDQNLAYLLGYMAWALGAALLVVLRSRTILSLGLRAGSTMHDDLLRALLRAPIAFFDATPIGRIIARFSRDMVVVDVALPAALQSCGSTLFAVLSALVVVCANSPPFLIAVLPLTFAYISFSSFYMASSRELKRLESMSRAPLLTHLSETFDGLQTIRAYSMQHRFGRLAEAALDRSVRTSLVSAIANCWLGLRLELLGAVLAAAAALLAFARNAPIAPIAAAAAATSSDAASDVARAVFGPATEAATAAAKEAASAAARTAAGVGRSALAVSLALQVTQALNWSVRQATELEANLVAVERMRSYLGVAPEAGYDLVERADAVTREVEAGDGSGFSSDMQGSTMETSLDAATVRRPSEEVSSSSQWWPWPGGGAGAGSSGADSNEGSELRGRLQLRHVGLRYRPDLPPALDDLTLTIQPTEKVGVVGRTGSGKSSLLMALTRLVAPPLRSGSIELDGVDIAELPLLPYRASLAVIPQEPTLFEGSVRFNLDPLGKHSAERLWQVLQRVQLAHVVRSLDDPVVEDGANLSAGQRQLLCIARALLANPAVVVMDEATSAVDAETDALIQRTVRQEFRDATVLTIAHRLNSVLDADKVIVLDKGRLVEFGSPKLLLGQRNGAFRAMVDAGGHLQD